MEFISLRHDISKLQNVLPPTTVKDINTEQRIQLRAAVATVLMVWIYVSYVCVLDAACSVACCQMVIIAFVSSGLHCLLAYFNRL